MSGMAEKMMPPVVWRLGKERGCRVDRRLKLCTCSVMWRSSPLLWKTLCGTVLILSTRSPGVAPAFSSAT
jgi:hypothetical protein